MVLVAECDAVAQTGGIAHQVGQEVLLHDAAEEMGLRADGENGHILARVGALPSVYVAGRIRGCTRRGLDLVRI